MARRFKLCFGVFAVVAALALSSAAEAALERLPSVSGWHMALDRSSAKPLCLSARYLQSHGAWMHYDHWRAGVRKITVYFPGAPPIAHRTPVQVTVTFDGRRGGERLELQGAAQRTETPDGAGFEATPRVLDLFRSANTIMVEYNGYRSPKLSLAGSSAAVAAVDACVASRL